MTSVIIVDDSEDVRTMMARVARRVGYKVAHTGDPLDFVEMVANDQPDLVAVDIIMPEKDGVELVGDLANIGFTGRLLLMSGYNGEFLSRASKLASAYGLDVIGTLSKPIDLNEFRRMLA